MTRFPRARFFFLAPALVASMAQAQAPEWKEAFKDTEKTVYIQVDSVQKSKRGVQVWLKHQFAAPLEIKEFNAKVTIMKEKAEYSRDRKWSVRILMYDASGKQVVDHSNPPQDAGVELIPETAEVVIAKQVWDLAPKGKKGTAAKTTR